MGRGEGGGGEGEQLLVQVEYGALHRLYFLVQLEDELVQLCEGVRVWGRCAYEGVCAQM